MDSFIKDYVEVLTEHYPEISSIWLIGSRANNTATDESDWDLMVFANNTTFESLRTNDKFISTKPKVDLLIVCNGNDFKSPWDDVPKQGSLKDWSWKEMSSVEATYRAGKWKPSVQPSDDNLPHYDGFDIRQLTAKKIWPKKSRTV